MGNKVCGDQHVAINPNLKKGNDNYLVGNYSQALQDYNQAIQDQPTNVHAYNNRARTFEKLNNINEAKNDLDKVIELDPENSDAYNNRGLAYRELGNLTEAQADYDKSILLNPHNSEAFINRANLHRQQQRYQDAINDYTAGIELNSRFGDGYLHRGLTYMRIQKYEEAIFDFTKAIEGRPEDGQAYAHRGYAYYQLNKHGQSNYDYSKALELSGGSEEAYFYRGKTSFHQQKYQQAESDFNQAINRQERNPLYKFYLASCQLNQGSNQKAGQHFEEGIASFQQQTSSDLAQNYHISYRQIQYIDGELKNYSDRMNRLQKIQNQSEMNGNNEITSEARQLKTELQDITIPRIANVEVISHNDEQRLRDLQSRTNDLEKRNMVSLSPQLKKILEEIKSINSSVFADDKISYIIDGIPESERRQYYDELYNFLLNHLLTYRVLYNAYYKDSSQNIQQIGNTFQEISFNQSITKKIPIFNDLVKAPYLIIEKQLDQQIFSLNKNVSHKVGTSSLKMEQIIADNVTYVVQELINNQEFNNSLIKGLNEDREAYLQKIWDQVAKGRAFDEQKVYQQAGVQCNPVQKVAIAHMILISKWFYEIDLQEFHKIVANQQLFYDQILKCLPPRQVTIKDQGLSSNDFQQMGPKSSVGCCQSGQCAIM